MSKSLLHAGPALLPVLLLTLSACMKEAVPDEPVPVANEIRFTDNVTRAGDSFSVGDRFYVWARAGDGTMLMENQEVVLTEDGWTYSPVKYWPLGQSVTFWAVTPSPDVFSRPDPSQEWLLYTQEEDASVETMTAGPVTVAEGQAVRLPFRHILTRVTLLARTDRPAPATKSVRIRSVTISNVPASAYFRSDGTCSGEVMGDKTVILDLDRIVDGTDKQPVGDGYLIPVPAGKTVGFQIHWDVIYKATGQTAEERTSVFTRDDQFLQQNSVLSFSLSLDGRIGLIDFEDEETKRLCVNYFDTDGDGEISYAEAESVTSLNRYFQNSGITRFNELRYFTSLTTIGSMAFYGCSQLQEITLPESVEAILTGAFHGCSMLQPFRFPTGITHIMDDAFGDCTSLTTVDLSELDCELGMAVFRGSGLQGIALPRTLKVIPERTFAQCDQLQHVQFFADNIYVGYRAFINCSSLASFPFHHVAGIADEGFRGSGLEKVTLTGFDSGQVGYGIFSYCHCLFEVNFGEDFRNIPDLTFAECEMIRELEFPNTLNYIGSGAFRGCTGLRELDFPESLAEIREHAFEGCGNIQTITSRARNAPTTQNDTFGSSTENYTGYLITGTKQLRILLVARGYNSDGWKTLTSDAGFSKKNVWNF